MIQYIVVGVILLCAVFFTIMRLIKRAKGDADCGCGKGKNCRKKKDQIR
jgi:hypothetical protein